MSLEKFPANRGNKATPHTKGINHPEPPSPGSSYPCLLFIKLNSFHCVSKVCLQLHHFGWHGIIELKSTQHLILSFCYLLSQCVLIAFKFYHEESFLQSEDIQHIREFLSGVQTETFYHYIHAVTTVMAPSIRGN